MKNRTTDAEIVQTLRAVRDTGSSRAAARELQIHSTTVDKRIHFAKERGLTADSPIRDPLEKLKTENARLKLEINSIHRHNETAEEIRREIYKLKEVDPEPPEWLISDAKIEGPGTPMMLWSDWHFGETVHKKEVGGLNEFNSTIAEQRVKLLVERSIGLVRHHMPDGVPGVVVCLGGDMMTGEIHQELADTNDKYVLETVRQLKSVLVGALTEIADAFGNVYVPCVVGNHGRATLKPRMKGVVQTSYEWNIYTDLEDRLAHDKRIKFTIPGETDILFAVHGHRFLLTHGDRLGVKGGDGIIGALGPIKRGEFKVRNSEAQIGRDFDTLLMGHWHQYLSTRGLIVNNCLKGYDEFARLALRAPATPASQALWFCHRKYGINAQMEVYVQELDAFRSRRRKSRKNEWVEVFNKE
jgi:predicted phosphodiesterase